MPAQEQPDGSRLILFAKYWEPGQVKTRLAADVGERAAAELFLRFLELSLERLSGVADRRVLYFSPANREREFRALAASEWELTPQTAGDLGQRLQRSAVESFQLGFERVVVVGSDSPTIPCSEVARAFSLLGTSRVVLGPADDGGYYLVGFRRPLVDMFDAIPWGTDQVWPTTLKRLAAAGLRERSGYAILDSWYDIDRLPQLRRLQAELADDRDPSMATAKLTALLTTVLDGRGSSHT